MARVPPCRNALFLDALWKPTDLHEGRLLLDSCPLLLADVDGRRKRHFLERSLYVPVKTKTDFLGWLQGDFDLIYVAAHGFGDKHEARL